MSKSTGVLQWNAAAASVPAELAKLFGRRLRYLRSLSGMTQVELSNKSAIGRAHLSRLERGRLLPRMDTVLRLAKAFGRNPADLVPSDAGVTANGGTANSRIHE